ncbi:hypothetical protein VZT92_020446 [Zoarces viviparus]|uniref:Uncharacterized protein n=1 Tax=Zoarces viviparus TaxID=48416 RepID=A0AAW1EEB1_ZOAVI
MALVTVQRSPTPSTTSSPSVSESGSGEEDRRSQPRSMQRVRSDHPDVRRVPSAPPHFLHHLHVTETPLSLRPDNFSLFLICSCSLCNSTTTPACWEEKGRRGDK